MDIPTIFLKNSSPESFTPQPVRQRKRDIKARAHLPRPKDISVSGTSVQTRGVSLVPSSVETFREIERKAMLFYLGLSSSIDSPALFRYLYQRKMAKLYELVRKSDTTTLKIVLTPELIKNERYVPCRYIPEGCISRDFAIACVEVEPDDFVKFGKLFCDSDFFLECLEKQPAVIKYRPDSGSDIDYEQLMNNYLPADFGFNLLLQYIPEYYRSASVCMASVLKEPASLPFVPQTVNNYEAICLEALRGCGNVLRHIPENKITAQMVQVAVNSLNPPTIMGVPEQYRTEENCLPILANKKNYDALKNVPESYYLENPVFFDKAIEHISWSQFAPATLQTVERYEMNLMASAFNIPYLPKELLLQHYDWCLKVCSEKGEFFYYVPYSMRDEKLCFTAVKNTFTSLIYGIPIDIMASRPEILELEALKGGLPRAWPNDKIDVSLCVTALAINPGSICSIPENLRGLLPQELLLQYAPKYLSNQNKQQLIETSDTYFLPHKKITVTDDDLLQGYAPCLHKNRGGVDALQSQLLTSRPFFLHNQEKVDRVLNEYIESHYQRRNWQLISGSLPVLKDVSDKYEVYGGRTMMLENEASCSRIKFLRNNEPLKELLREEAIHLFIQNNPALLPLKSEVPVSNGVYLIRWDDMPEAQLKLFKSTLKRVTINRVDYFLGYQFSTRDRNYSELAHRPDATGGFQKSEQGLLNACFDLGVWSSAGIVHTSTMMAYHNLSENRRYLFLAPLFGKNYKFPGSMFTLNSESLKETDWSRTGLKDLGDFESYPNITSYVRAQDSQFMVPGYGQRCSFINAFL